MIQDIFPEKLDNQYDPERVPDLTSYVMHFSPGGLLIRKEGSDCFFTFGELSASSLSSLIYLFSISGRSYFLSTARDLTLPSSGIYVNLHDFRENFSFEKHQLLAAFTAFHLYSWYDQNRFCGRCGSPLSHSKSERALICPSCAATFYPRIVPAVIVGVRKGDELLLTKYKRGYEHYALIAGFAEIGETLEETVAREVMEEAGIRVKNISYYKSQPWGIVQDLLAGFFCDVDGDPTITMDEGELKMAEWKKREEILLQPDDLSLTNEMMKRFKEGTDPVSDKIQPLVRGQ